LKQELDRGEDDYKVVSYEEHVQPLEFTPGDLKKTVKKPEEMNLKELWDYITKVESEGYDSTIYRVNMHAKITAPIICIIMCLVGTGLTTKTRIHESMPLNIVLGLLMAFFYIVLQSFCLALGHGGVLPPFIAAWTTNFVFLCIGALTLINAE
jgi:lipopolysaccharide export system permease protein